MSQIACSKTAPCSSGSRPLRRELAPPTRPRHAQRPPRIQRLVVGDHRRRERARRQPDRARRLADRDTRELGIALGRRELRSGCDLVERQRARAQRMVERRQTPKRHARLRDLHRVSVVAARDLREPLRTRRAARRPPVAASSAARTSSVNRCSSRACCAHSRHHLAADRLSRRRSSASSTAPSTAANIRSSVPAHEPPTCADSVPKRSAYARWRESRAGGPPRPPGAGTRDPSDVTLGGASRTDWAAPRTYGNLVESVNPPLGGQCSRSPLCAAARPRSARSCAGALASVRAGRGTSARCRPRCPGAA